MRARATAIASLITIAAAAPGAAAAVPLLAASPARVHRGHTVRLHGTLRGCPAGDRVTLISHAFGGRRRFAGVPAVEADVGAGGAYSVTVRIPRGRRAARYTITGRCGGGNLGVAVILHVLR